METLSVNHEFPSSAMSGREFMLTKPALMNKSRLEISRTIPDPHFIPTTGGTCDFLTPFHFSDGIRSYAHVISVNRDVLLPIVDTDGNGGSGSIRMIGYQPYSVFAEVDCIGGMVMLLVEM